ncbi:MAG: thiamine diphosphokinase [Anaerolineae bacterium]|nr:thiamine diphosphokinase [Anaerolineae bacterium]
MSRIIIFANGILNKPKRLKARLRPDDRIFCADGGTKHALTLGLIPEAIIGDLDSLSPADVERMAAQGVTLHRYPAAKDETDLELALRLAVAENPAEIMVVTLLGGRLDQMLANLLLLTHPDYAAVQMTFADSAQWGQLIRAHQTVTVAGQPGDILSLVPLTPTVSDVTFEGVDWPLTRATLSFGSTWSISNSLTDQQATVHIGEGMVLLIHIDQNFEEE